MICIYRDNYFISILFFFTLSSSLNATLFLQRGLNTDIRLLALLIAKSD